jgi:predicted alpha/beta-fold hydrolase
MIDDLEAVVEHIQTVFQPTHTFMVGFSLGSIQAVRYASKHTNVDGYVLVSHVLDSGRSAVMLDRPIQKKLYQKIIVAKLTHILKKNPFIPPELQGARNVRSLDDYEREYTCKLLGFATPQDYYNQLHLKDYVGDVTAPMLVLGADNDPFTEKAVQPKKEITASKSVALVTYPVGGHVGLCIGLDGKRSMVDILMPQWFDIIIANVPKTQ